jgi:hypothetical protein
MSACKLDATLTKDEAEYIAAFIADENATDDEVVRLMVGDGHAGYGLYAAHPDYAEEGAVLVKNLPNPAGAAPTVEMDGLMRRVLDALECGCLWAADSEAEGRMRRTTDEFRAWLVKGQQP